MCGIVGYIGGRDAYDILIKGLHRLEYRGYDSAGVALVNDDHCTLNVYKSRGKVSELERFCSEKDTTGHLGIAHTRWATHGEPNDVNAHPHTAKSGRIALVHNGTIENYNVLKEALEQQGCTFRSETDTEVLVQLIDYIKTSTHCSTLERRAQGSCWRLCYSCSRLRQSRYAHRRPQKFAACGWCGRK